MIKFRKNEPNSKQVLDAVLAKAKEIKETVGVLHRSEISLCIQPVIRKGTALVGPTEKEVDQFTLELKKRLEKEFPKRKFKVTAKVANRSSWQTYATFVELIR